MGIKTHPRAAGKWNFTLKNLPTTWGLRRTLATTLSSASLPLKNLPTTWGLRPLSCWLTKWLVSLKNLPTTWGLRHEFWVVFRQLQAL